MTCDICHRHATQLLCPTCEDMIQRLLFVDRRMHTRELCESERLAQVAAAATATQAQTETT